MQSTGVQLMRVLVIVESALVGQNAVRGREDCRKLVWEGHTRRSLRGQQLGRGLKGDTGMELLDRASSEGEVSLGWVIEGLWRSGLASRFSLFHAIPLAQKQVLFGRDVSFLHWRLFLFRNL